MIVFDYAPNLKIAGTYHSLTEEEKQTLELYIEESDFVALEWDLGRHNEENVEIKLATADKMEYSESEGKLYASFWNCLYCILHESLSSYRIRKLNKRYGREDQVVQWNEFEYCHAYSKERGKDVHLVDIPHYQLLEKLVDELKWHEKIRDLLSYFGICKTPPNADKIMITFRNQRMLENIEKLEGPIDELKRKGILIVGYSHAQEYLGHFVGQKVAFHGLVKAQDSVD